MGLFKKIKKAAKSIFGGKQKAELSTPVVSTVAKVTKPSADAELEARRRAASARGRYTPPVLAGDDKLGA